MKPKYIAIIILALVAVAVSYIAIKSPSTISTLPIFKKEKVVDVSKQYQPICDLSKFNIPKKISTPNFYEGSENEIPDAIKQLVINIVHSQSEYKNFVKTYPGASEFVESMSTYPFTYVSRASTKETTPLLPLNIITDAKQDSIIVRYFIPAPGGWIPEDHPSYNAYIDICHLKVY
jgi:hypothetical protein